MDDVSGSRNANSERKRPHDVISIDDCSNTNSTNSTPRKRNKCFAKLGQQDVANAALTAGSFGTSPPHSEAAQDNKFDDARNEPSLPMEDQPVAGEDKEHTTDVATAASGEEGRRLYVGNLPRAATEDDIRQLFNGFAM